MNAKIQTLSNVHYLVQPLLEHNLRIVEYSFALHVHYSISRDTGEYAPMARDLGLSALRTRSTVDGRGLLF